MSVSVSAPSSPYKGLAPFEDSDVDALLFFGREPESEVIAANLIASRITVLYGPSGVGKSSVLRAGVAYRLRQEREAEVIVFSTWIGDPAAALVEAAGGTGRNLADALADAADRAGGDLYVILDQFEELFLYHKGGGEFAQQLAGVLRRGGLRVNVLIGMREDSLARLDALKASIPNLLANRLRLDRLDRAAGAAAIVGPLARYNELVPPGERVEIEPELELAVVDQVTAGRVELGSAGRGVAVAARDDNRIEAPYLQLVLTRLWEVERARGSNVLRLATLKELGGAEHIVEAHLEQAMAELSPREKGAAAAMYHFLVTPSGTKIAHGVGDLAGYAALPLDEAAGVLRRLTAERIVRASSENGPTTTRYEIFHDVLADAVVAWRTRFEAERALEDERVLHRRRQRRLIAIGVTALLAMAVMAAIAIYALDQRGEAQHQTAVARQQQAKAEHSARTANTALAREAKAKKKAQAYGKKAKQSEEKYRRAAADATRQENKAIASANSERRARERADATAVALRSETHRANKQKRLAQQETRKKTRAQLAAVRQKNIARAEELEAEARLLLATDAEKSVRRALAALQAFRTARIPTLRVENTLRDGILALRLRAVIHLPRPGAVHVVRFSPDDGLAFVGGAGGAALYDLKHVFAGRPLLPHSNIADAAFSPDGQLVAGAAAGKDDRVVHVWDVRTGAEVFSLPHDGPVDTVAFSPKDGHLIASGSVDGTARLWSSATGQQLAVFRPDAGQRGNDVQHVEFSPDGGRLLTVGGSKFVQVFDVSRHTEAFTLDNAAPVNMARFSHNGSMIATAGATEAVRLWNAGNGALENTLDLTGRVADLAFSPNDKLLATAGSNDTVGRILNLEKPTAGATITLHRSGIKSVVFTPDGLYVLTTGRDKTAVLSGVAAGFPAASLTGHTRSVEGADVSRDGALIGTWSEDGTARIWSAPIGFYAREIGKHDTPATARRGPAVAFSPTGGYMVSAGADGSARVWRGASQGHLLQHEAPVNSVSFSRKGTVITGSDDGTARVWRAATGRLIATLTHGAPVTAARLTRDGRVAVTAGRDGLVKVWNLAAGSVSRSYDLGGVVNDMELSANGRFVVAGSSNKSAAVYGVKSASDVLLTGHTDAVVAVVFAPDGKRVATASADTTARIWDARTGASIATLTRHTGTLTALAFNGDGSRLATTGADSNVWIWNGRTGREITVLQGHSGQVNDLAFSEDGRWLASAGPLAVGIWATRDWPASPYYVYGVYPPGPRGGPRLDHVAFSPHGWRLLTGWRNGAVRAYTCDVCGGVTQLRAIAKNQLAQIARPARPR